MPPLVSILIPAYNAQHSVGQTIRSALAQTWRPKEIIVVDDGSSDGTPEVVNGFAAEGVRLVQQKNQGAAAARNAAYSEAKGDYIQWLDADDLLEPDKVERQMKMAIQENNPRLLWSAAWGSFLHRYQNAKFTRTVLWENLSPVEWLCRKCEQGVFMQTACWLVSRELSDAAGPWNTRLLGDDDGEYFCRVLLACERINFVPEAKVFYRVPTTNNLSYIGRSDRKMDAHFLSMELHLKYLGSLGETERTKSARIKYLQWWLISFYPERMDLVEKLRTMARVLGADLRMPQLSWKYRWIQKVFGWNAAKTAQRAYNQWKGRLLHEIDRIQYQRELRRQ
jgi:glycosyltransferase involved in cell wall biosynthesis